MPTLPFLMRDPAGDQGMERIEVQVIGNGPMGGIDDRPPHPSPEGPITAGPIQKFKPGLAAQPRDPIGRIIGQGHPPHQTGEPCQMTAPVAIGGQLPFKARKLKLSGTPRILRKSPAP